MKCMHETLGYPPKKHWELQACQMVDKDGNVIEEEYICDCPRGKKAVIIREIPADNEWWEKEGKYCSYCGKKLTLRYRRAYYRECRCGSRWYL